jgi:hypothetical protein
MLADVWPLFEDNLFPVPSTEEVFNPYHTRHEELDRADAPQHRRQNLKNYVAHFDAAPPLFLLAEAPGPWGCRFSGVPITSEAQLADSSFPIDGTPTSREAEPHTEYSASIFWRVLQPYASQFFVWNALPLHPHDRGDPLTIRTPRRTEVREWQPLLTGLLEALEPDRVVGLGRKGERALDEVGADPTYVRHPSQGGATKFEEGMHAIIDAMNLPRSTPA